jgi:hypothetical protein
MRGFRSRALLYVVGLRADWSWVWTGECFGELLGQQRAARVQPDGNWDCDSRRGCVSGVLDRGSGWSCPRFGRHTGSRRQVASIGGNARRET